MALKWDFIDKKSIIISNNQANISEDIFLRDEFYIFIKGVYD